jgi:hypothetical protein
LRFGALALAVAGLLLLGCSGDSKSPIPTSTPLPPTEEPTSTPEAPTATPTQPPLGTPEVPAGVVVLGEGTVALSVAPGDRQLVEPLTLAQAFGAPPACAGFAFTFRWRTDDGAPLRIEGQLRGATVQVAEGAEGETTSGCMVLEFVNDGDSPVTGELTYRIGEFR